MTTAVTATPTPPTNHKVGPEVLQDILYEILANGLDPREKHITAAQIEQFLFEHARAPKTPEAFYEFFKNHALSTDPDDHLKSLEIKGLPLSPPAGNAPLSPIEEQPSTCSASNDNADNSETTSPKIEKAALSKPVQQAPAPASEPVAPTATRGPGARTVWAAAAGIVILLGIGAGLGFAIANLQAEVAQAKSAQRESEQAVLELQQRISGLQSEVVRNGQSVERLEPQIDRLVETLAPQQPAQQNEQPK